MKKILVSLLFAALMIPAFLKSDLSAGDLSVGATAWYTTWDMGDPMLKPDPGIMYGPVASYMLNDDFNLTLLFLYGSFNAPLADGANMDIIRYDSDLALNYKISSYFKLFAGAKVMRYNYSTADSLSSTDLSMISVGPGAGISAVYPIKDNLFFLGNLSAMYLWSTMEMTFKMSGFPEQTSSDSTNLYGFNMSAALAYYFSSASTTVSLGGRYQTIDSTDSGSAKHTFMGVTLAAIYTFSSAASE